MALADLARTIKALETRRLEGRVRGINGLVIEVTGPPEALALGARGRITTSHGDARAEIVGFRDGLALMTPYDAIEGLRPGAIVVFDEAVPTVSPSSGWLGRVINAFGEPIDGLGALPEGSRPRLLRASPPPAHARTRVGARMDLGVRALNTYAALCKGQRIGVFAGSGVGKSVLMSMLARNAEADIIVIGLIGERGREVREFIEDTLGPEGLKRAVVIVATSDESALRRRQAAWMTMSVAEHFRDEGRQVLCMLDSVTRFAMAQREIGLAAGEPPTTKGYTPTVFSELPRLLERAGPGVSDANGVAGAITAVFTILVDGDDHNEPVADAARGILDGHIVMERAIAERGRYPAINVLKSISRLMPECHTPEERILVRDSKRIMAAYADMEELIRIGAYQAGSDLTLDRAIALNEPLEAYLRQEKHEHTTFEAGFSQLAEILQLA